MVRVNTSTGAVELLDANGSLTWAVHPLGCAASIVLPIDGTDDSIVLLDPDAQRGAFRNLLRLSATGTIEWQAELHSANDDAYVAVQWSGGQLFANTWSGYRVHIDLTSGQILDASFTK